MNNSRNWIASLILVFAFFQTNAQQSVDGNMDPMATHSSQAFGIGCDYAISVSDMACFATSYTFPDGSVANNVISQVVHVSELQTVVTACDSIITTTVNPYPYNFRTESFFGICQGHVYTFPDGVVDTIYEHTEYTSYLQSVVTGCDSIVETILNTTDINLGVSVSGNQLTAQQSNAGYQWVDCNDGFSQLSGQDGQTFIAPNGSFAVIIYKGNCIDTSACQQVLTIGIGDVSGPEITVFSSPGSGIMQLDLGLIHADVAVTLRNLMGQELWAGRFKNRSTLQVETPNAKGIYLIELKGSNGLNRTYKVFVGPR